MRYLIAFCFVTSICAAPYAVVSDSDLSLYRRVISGVGIETPDFFEVPFTEIQTVESKEPSVIIAIGPKSTAAAIKHTKNIPIIYCMVPSLENYHFKADNVVGIRLEQSYDNQLAMLQSVFPSVRRVGVFYHPEKSKAEIKRAEAAARRVGLVLVTAKLPSVDAVDDALQTFRGNIDALWMISDPVALHVQVVDATLKYSIEHQLPFMALDDGFVDQGALISFATAYAWVGRQAASLAHRMVSQGKLDQHVFEPEGMNIAVNMLTSQKISLSPEWSLNLLNYAAEQQLKIKVFRGLL